LVGYRKGSHESDEACCSGVESSFARDKARGDPETAMVVSKVDDHVYPSPVVNLTRHGVPYLCKDLATDKGKKKLTTFELSKKSATNVDHQCFRAKLSSLAWQDPFLEWIL
jgi:hypothetical protein